MENVAETIEQEIRRQIEPVIPLFKGCKWNVSVHDIEGKFDDDGTWIHPYWLGLIEVYGIFPDKELPCMQTGIYIDKRDQNETAIELQVTDSIRGIVQFLNPDPIDD